MFVTKTFTVEVYSTGKKSISITIIITGDKTPENNQSQCPSAHTDGGMHKSSEYSDKDCIWNEDAPTVISCAHF